jgi:N-sulfoglucosamine sulfohydrolase
VLSLAGVPVPSHMQGQVFLGKGTAPPRQYVFAHRDRMDEAYDRMRAVHDGRYEYIRNFFPGRPYAQHIDYMEEMPTMREMRRVYKEHFNALSPNYGKAMTEAQQLFFRPEKPAEELYDLNSDPHEVKSLANSEAHQSELKRLRQALEQWQKETKDLGAIPEDELREQMRPGGVWAQASRPKITTTGAESSDSFTVRMTCETQGASIAYTTEAGDRARWKLYSQEITLKRPVSLRAKACRLGFIDSSEAVQRFE